MAIDLLTYEFLKRYVEGSQMGQYAKPQGKWDETKTYSTGDYVTYNNTVYIVPFNPNASANSSESEKIQTATGVVPGTNETKWQEIAGVNATGGGISEEDFITLLSDNLNIQNAEPIDDNSFNNIMQKPEAHAENVTWESKNEDVKDYLSNNSDTTIQYEIVDASQKKYNIKHGVYASGKGGNAAVFGGKSQAIGTKSFATGSKNIALGGQSFATGSETFAKGQDAFSSGNNTSALGNYSHTEGQLTKAQGNHSHAEGRATKAVGNASHAEGGYTTAAGERSHAEGDHTVASGRYSHAEGQLSETLIDNSHVEGYKTIAGIKSYKITSVNLTAGNIAFDSYTGLGMNEIGYFIFLHPNKNYTAKYTANIGGGASGYLDLEDIDTKAFIDSGYLVSGIEVLIDNGYKGSQNYTNPYELPLSSHAEGSETWAGAYAHAEGIKTIAKGFGAHAEGNSTQAIGDYSHSEGTNSQAKGINSHAEGNITIALDNNAHAEGYKAEANGKHSHAEGANTKANKEASHAEGVSSIADGLYSHTEGNATQTKGQASHAEGDHTIATAKGQHVEGRYNIEDTTKKYAHIIGNGTAEERSNAMTVDWNGNMELAGGIILTDTANSKKYKLTITNGALAINEYNA